MTRKEFFSAGGSDRIKFVEAKALDMELVAQLLNACRACNQWTNFGPLNHMLADEYARHVDLDAGRRFVPCANGGVALEAQARLLAASAGQKALRWVGSAFSFKNLGRGYFADMQFLDCDMHGMLDLAELERLPAEGFDGVIVTNPLGMARDFDAYIRFAERSGKALLIDNAAGMDQTIPKWPWQAFSLHHTKPYGFGEGGLALVPAAAAEDFISLINYDHAPADPSHWFNNGKLSDVACAFQIARLRQTATWRPRYHAQHTRIGRIIRDMGLSSWHSAPDKAPATFIPVLYDTPLEAAQLKLARPVDIARHYPPLAPRVRAAGIFSRLISFPAHPDMEQLSDSDIRMTLAALKPAAPRRRTTRDVSEDQTAPAFGDRGAKPNHRSRASVRPGEAR